MPGDATARARAVLLDIEGTSSSIAFVHEVLFPYARNALPAFVREHAWDPMVRAQLDATAAEAGIDGDDLDAISDTLVAWIDADRKVTPLKSLQGMIWEAGYRSGAFRAHLYPDTLPALTAWQASGLPIYIYSSGSIQAQKLFFEHSEAGDLRHLLSGHFDTGSGGKKEADSYRNIAKTLGLPPEDIVFLSASRPSGSFVKWRAVTASTRLRTRRIQSSPGSPMQDWSGSTDEIASWAAGPARFTVTDGLDRSAGVI